MLQLLWVGCCADLLFRLLVYIYVCYSGHRCTMCPLMLKVVTQLSKQGCWVVRATAILEGSA
jgi:hypothetical protein